LKAEGEKKLSSSDEISRRRLLKVLKIILSEPRQAISYYFGLAKVSFDAAKKALQRFVDIESSTGVGAR